MTTEEALIQLADSTSEAVAQVLDVVSQSTVERSKVAVVHSDDAPLRSIPMPAVVSNVSYIDGVTGGNIFVMTRLGVQRLAAAMMGMDAGAVEESEELSELDLSAAGEAMNQMMAAAAGATAHVLQEEIEISPPETRLFATHDEAVAAYELTPHMTSVGFTLLGEPCRLLQLVPNAFVVRMTTALDELGSEVAPAAEPAAASAARPAGVATPGRPSLSGIPVRVWAELGRTRMPSAQVVGMPAGSVVELNQAADEPIDLYVNGTLFATGRLMVVDGTDWAVRIETVLSPSNTSSSESQMEVARWPESW
jgi:flagellar motor switch protein FliN/FliY